MGYNKPPYYLTAYGLAVRQGFSGSLDEWLKSLHGDDVELRYLEEKLQWRRVKSTEELEAEDGWQDLLDMTGTREAIFTKAQQEVDKAVTAAGRSEAAATRSENAENEVKATLETVNAQAGRSEAAAERAEESRQNAEADADRAEEAVARAEKAANDTLNAAESVANKKPQDLKVTATFDTVVSDTISTGTAGTSAYGVATAISQGATVTLIDDDNRVYKYCGYRLEPNYSNAFFEAQEVDANGITTYRATINNEGQASRTKYTHEYATANTDPDRHAEYFTITEDGVLSLKPEYRGANAKTAYTDATSDKGLNVAGSKNAELPSYLVIPEVVNEIAVDSIALGAFAYNAAIISIVFPKTVKEIPEACFRDCANLKNLYNTGNVRSIGKSAFQNSGLQSGDFPNLQTLANLVFCQCTDLTHVNVGNITAIADDAFFKCFDLSRVDSENLITSVGVTAFHNTHRLVNAKFVKNLTSIGNGAFIGSGLDYDWASLPNCTFGANATAWQMQYEDATKFWELCSFTACQNPLPTLLCQRDPRWQDEKVRGSAKTWYSSCQLFALMFAYSGLNNLPFETVTEFEDEVERVAGEGYLANWTGGYTDRLKDFAAPLGLTLTEYAGFDQSNLQALYDALAAGKYAIVTVPSGNVDGRLDGHSVLLYGITASGKLMFADSEYAEYHDYTKGATYEVLYKNQIGRDNLQTSSADGDYDSVWFLIVEKT